MFSLCHIPLVDLGQHFLSNLAVITKEGCAGKTEWFKWSLVPSNPDWKSSDLRAASVLIIFSAEETLLSHVCSVL